MASNTIHQGTWSAREAMLSKRVRPAPGSAASGWWLFPTPLKHMSSSTGMMTFSNIWENKSHVPNHSL